MREVALFVEDYAHQQIIDALVQRMADEYNLEVRLDWRSAVRGHGMVVRELTAFLHNLIDQGGPRPHLVVVATDANCKGLNARRKEIERLEAPAPMVLAVPDPHIERWLLLDGAAFRSVFGKGCDAPDRKCDRNRYKHRLTDAIRATGITPNLGGIEFAHDIVAKIDIARASRADRSFKRFVDDLRDAFRELSRPEG